MNILIVLLKDETDLLDEVLRVRDQPNYIEGVSVKHSEIDELNDCFLSEDYYEYAVLVCAETVVKHDHCAQEGVSLSC